MNLARIAYRNVRKNGLSSALSVMLFGFGILIIVLILLVSAQLKNEIEKNATGVDLVIGAKGSPMQLILANIFHVDFPTGNISLKESANLTRNRLIKKVIPMSLGDSYQGYRIVGTTEEYLALYEGTFDDGEWTGESMQASIGSEVSELLELSVGDQFQSTHGLAETGAGHADHPFVVSGVLKKSGSVLDRLILVSVESVWAVHGHEEGHEAHHDSLHQIKEIPWMSLSVTGEQYENEDITGLLIQYASPMAAIRLPQMVNGGSNFQAASPAFETARLFNLIGTGVDVMNLLGLAIIIISAVSVLIALINSLKERKYELAILRAMGASRLQIFFLILFEGFFLTVFGVLVGFSAAHLGIWILDQMIETMNFDPLFLVSEELDVLVGAVVIGVISAIVPGLMAYRSDISKTLAKG